MYTIHTCFSPIGRRFANALIFSVLTIALFGCGGGGGSTPDPVPLTGRFVDATVEGLNYDSGSQSGSTTGSGAFSYLDGETVEFSVGGIVLGTALGAELITPLDLPAGGDTDNTVVQNIARFLLMLDNDGDSGNGIRISNAVQAIATSWPQVDFNTDDLPSALVSIQSDVASVDGRMPILPDAMTAKAHLESSLSCLASGIYAGTYSGDDNGTYLLWVQSQRYDPLVFSDVVPRIGVTSALVFSSDDNQVMGVTPRQGLTFNTDKGFISGEVSSGARFGGELLGYKTVANGVWQNSDFAESGTFSGGRRGGSPTASHRISAFFNTVPAGSPFSADGSGLLAVDVFDDNTVTGVVVTLRGDQHLLNGVLANGVIDLSNSSSSFSMSFDADGSDPNNDAQLGTSAGVVGSGLLSGSAVDVIGSSCKLN